MGPDLKTVVGRKAGSLPGYSYSPAMKGEKISWTPENLETFLTKPQDFVKGTKMFFPGLPNAADRADVIAYLKSLKTGK
jgi:cytochrome c